MISVSVVQIIGLIVIYFGMQFLYTWGGRLLFLSMVKKSLKMKGLIDGE